MKTCIKCNIEKDFNKFYKNKTKKDGLHNKCKECMNKHNKQWKTLNKDKHSEYLTKYHSENSEKIKDYDKQWIKNNINYKKDYYKKNKSHIIIKGMEWRRKKLKKDPLFKLRIYLGNRINFSIQNQGYKKTSKTHELLGASFEVVKKHIEKQFIEGMNWDNYGVWYIDHKIPLSSAKNEEELINLFHYINLQPLWALDNLKKGAKLNYNI